MNRTLSPNQKDEIRQSFFQSDFSIEATVAKMVAEGYDEANAQSLIVSEWKAYRRELFLKEVKRRDQEEHRKAAFLVIIIVSAIGPVFNSVSPLWWNVCALAIAGTAGYYAYRDKPVAGILGSIIVPIVFPFVHDFYFSGRTSYIRIEMAIPMILAVIPAYTVYYILSKAVYAEN